MAGPPVYAAATVAALGSLTHFSKNSQSIKLVHDGTQWWAFYYKSGTANTLFAAYSSSNDLTSATWSESSVALGGTVVTDGGTVTLTYHASDTTVFVTYYTNTNRERYMRGAITPASHSISWSANTNYGGDSAKNAGSDYGTTAALNTSGIVWYVFPDASANFHGEFSAAALSSSFADTGANWTSKTPGNQSDYNKRNAVFALASGAMINIFGDLSGGNGYLRSSKYSGGAWAAYVSVFTAAAGSDSVQWGATSVDTTHTYALAITATSTMGMYVYDGSNWTAKTGPSYPTNGITTNSGISCTNNGTNVWCFVIRGDGSTTLSSNKYTVGSDSWGGWTTVNTTTSGTDVAASFLTACGFAGVLYTESSNLRASAVSTGDATCGGGATGQKAPLMVIGVGPGG